jgi:methylmalonyl-CoA mutase N-terminal domain/subunit
VALQVPRPDLGRRPDAPAAAQQHRPRHGAGDGRIFGGLQSLHTDAYDEAYATPSEAGARIAVATQNILREEAHLTDVIDPLGGSFYVESLTDQMEEKIVAIMKTIDDAGGMYKAVEAGLVQR